MVNPRRFYTYAYLREDRSPYYIGKGESRRAYNKHQRGISVPKDKSRIIFLKQNLTEDKAFNHEKYMIAVLGRKDLGTGILHNRTDGGEGTSGWVPSEETRKRMREVNKGENNPMYGKSHSQEIRIKLSEVNKGENHPMYGKSYSEEIRKRMSEAKKGKNNPMYGKSHSQETRRKQSEVSKGKYIGGNHPMYGKSHSQETKRKQSEANKGKKWWNDGKGNTKLSKESPGPNWVSGRGKIKIL